VVLNNVILSTPIVCIVLVIINITVVSSTCFQHTSVHPQEDLYMQFYGISVMHPYKQPGR